MFVICDQDDVVRDIATEEANLSRGHSVVDARLYLDVDAEDIRIGDTFKNGTLTRNIEDRQKRAEKAVIERRIAAVTRSIAIAELISLGELPPDYKGL